MRKIFVSQAEIAMQTIEALSDYERERGKPIPSKNHSFVQMFLMEALLRYKNQFTIMPELNLELGGRRFVPDLCVFPTLKIDWLHDRMWVTESPLLSIEILSPEQAIQDLVEKIEAYFAGGVQSCWLVKPTLRTIAVFTPRQQPQVYSQGTFTDRATEIEINVDAVFEQ